MRTILCILVLGLSFIAFMYAQEQLVAALTVAETDGFPIELIHPSATQVTEEIVATNQGKR